VQATPTAILLRVQQSAGNHAAGALLQRIHFGATRGVSEEYAGEEAREGPQVATFAGKLEDDVEGCWKRYDALKKVGPAAVMMDHPISHEEVPISEVREHVIRHQQTWKKQLPTAFGDIPDDWDYADRADRLARARKAMSGGVARVAEVDRDAFKVNLGPTLTRSDSHLEQPAGPASTADSSTFVSGPGWEIFVLSWTGEMYMASHRIGQFHHSSFLAGKDVAAAGEIKTDASGKVMVLNNKSGHYLPKERHVRQLLHLLRKRKVPLDFQLDLKTTDEPLSTTASEWFNNDAYRAERVAQAWEELWAAREDPSHTPVTVMTEIANAGGWVVGSKSSDDFSGGSVEEGDSSTPVLQYASGGKEVSERDVRRAIKTLLGTKGWTPQAGWHKPGTGDVTEKRAP
jgi:hypothetical protein